VHEKTLNKTLGTSWQWQILNVWKNPNHCNLYNHMACYHVVVNECFVQMTPFMIGFNKGKHLLTLQCVVISAFKIIQYIGWVTLINSTHLKPCGLSPSFGLACNPMPNNFFL
jgi:hypothetical protein